MRTPEPSQPQRSRRGRVCCVSRCHGPLPLLPRARQVGQRGGSEAVPFLTLAPSPLGDKGQGSTHNSEGVLAQALSMAHEGAPRGGRAGAPPYAGRACHLGGGREQSTLGLGPLFLRHGWANAGPNDSPWNFLPDTELLGVSTG